MQPPDRVEPADAPVTDPSAGAPSGYVVPPGAVQPAGRRRVPVTGLAVAVVALLAGAALFLSGWSLGSHQATTPGTPAGDEAIFQPFWSAYHYVVDNYAGGTVDQKKLVEGAIKGMIDSLGDPYSQYLTSEEFRQSLQGISGEFEGIGADITTEKADGTQVDCSTLGPDCRLAIVSPLEGSPAEKAGLKPGDLVLTVDGTSLDGLTIDQARDRIRGRKGTVVTLGVQRGTQKLSIPITRDVIHQQEVITKDLAGGSVGYVRITGFSETAADTASAAIKADVAKGERKIVLDLRGNPGGFVTAAREVASQFIASGPIYWQEDAHGNKVEVDAQGNGAATDPSIKVAVLIDKGSASASEIVAGALQDTGRATLVGETSFGKGTVQQWQDLSDDNGGFRLTIAKWLTPKQRWIHHVGLTPDVPVTVPANPPAGSDPVLDRALTVLGAALALAPAA